MSSMGMGKTIVEFFSEEMVDKVWRYLKQTRVAALIILVHKCYLSCKAAGDSEMMSLASLRALEAFCSPSAAITFKGCY